MDLSDIRAFLAVAEELHFTRAAERLHMGQPPLSRTIKELERELGCQLFDRSTRSVTLTPQGHAFFQPAKKVVEAFYDARSAVTDIGPGSIGRVRIGFSGASTYRMIGQLARTVNAEYPGIELVLDSSTYADQGLKKVLNGSLDLGIVRWLAPPQGVASRVISKEELVMALPAHHRLAHESEIDLRDLTDEPFLTLPADSGSIVRESFVRATQAAGYAPRIVQEAPDSWTLMALVAAGVGCNLTVSTIFDNLVTPGVVCRPLKQRIKPLEVRLAWLKSNRNSALRQVVKLSVRALPGPASDEDEKSPQNG
ncbi:LysR family transcriptional regulator [Rhodococcus pseudokoreensis]|uniref:LysR family transcriptional regulator n=1 Tax=Rhodococcus pseudokoreensis TaxID=2811421 RepID=A0A974W7X9_9NOCA|nr:LysR substrate-binding domain-containing protein [Rhodococcus pseudokoreensis]QSE92791.1 LysR family transcriptional regulator [Rhodococcus pseudokoreensis]